MELDGHPQLLRRAGLCGPGMRQSDHRFPRAGGGGSGAAMSLDWIGWVATAVFAVSYFCKQPARLRQVQSVAALLWLSYGLAIGAMPVVVANIIVAAMALGSTFKLPSRDGGGALRQGPSTSAESTPQG